MMHTKYNGSKTPTVKIKGKGNFKGTVTRTFTIEEMKLTTARAAGALVVSAPDTAYSTKKGGFKSKISLTFDGIKLKAGTDYEKKIEYKYHLTGEPIADNEKNIPAGTEIDFTITAKPGSGFKGTISGTYRITKYDINKLTVKVKDKGYVSGGVYLDTSDISFKGYYNDDVTFVIDETSYKNNFKKGKATVVIKGTGDYGGTKTITYKIVVRKALIWQLPSVG